MTSFKDRSHRRQDRGSTPMHHRSPPSSLATHSWNSSTAIMRISLTKFSEEPVGHPCVRPNRSPDSCLPRRGERSVNSACRRHPERCPFMFAARGKCVDPGSQISRMHSQQPACARICLTCEIVPGISHTTKIQRPTVLRWPFCLGIPAYTWGRVRRAMDSDRSALHAGFHCLSASAAAFSGRQI